MRKLHKNTIKKALRQGKVISVYLAPSNVNSYHINSGWHLGFFTTVICLEQLEEMIQSFAIYNCNSELGNSVRFWIDNEKWTQTKESYLAELKANYDKLGDREYDSFCILLIEERKRTGNSVDGFTLYPSFRVEKYMQTTMQESE